MFVARTGQYPFMTFEQAFNRLEQLNQSPEDFWNNFSGIDDVSEEFKQVFTGCCQHNPNARPTLDELLEAPWMENIDAAQIQQQARQELASRFRERMEAQQV